MSTIEQLPAEVNVRIWQGDSWTQSFIFRDDTEAHEPIPIGGWTIAGQIRGVAMPSNVADLAIDMTAADDGQVTVRLAAAASSKLAIDCVWDLQRIDGGDTRTLLHGVFTVERQVTR